MYIPMHAFILDFVPVPRLCKNRNLRTTTKLHYTCAVIALVVTDRYLSITSHLAIIGQLPSTHRLCLGVGEPEACSLHKTDLTLEHDLAVVLAILDDLYHRARRTLIQDVPLIRGFRSQIASTCTRSMDVGNSLCGVYLLAEGQLMRGDLSLIHI